MLVYLLTFFKVLLRERWVIAFVESFSLRTFKCKELKKNKDWIEFVIDSK